MKKCLVIEDVVTTSKTGIAFSYLEFAQFLEEIFDKCETVKEVEWLQDQIKRQVDKVAKDHM